MAQGYLRSMRATFRRLYYRTSSDLYVLVTDQATAMECDASPNLLDVTDDKLHEATYRHRMNHGGKGTC